MWTCERPRCCHGRGKTTKLLSSSPFRATFMMLVSVNIGNIINRATSSSIGVNSPMWLQTCDFHSSTLILRTQDRRDSMSTRWASNSSEPSSYSVQTSSSSPLSPSPFGTRHRTTDCSGCSNQTIALTMAPLLFLSSISATDEGSLKLSSPLDERRIGSDTCGCPPHHCLEWYGGTPR